MGDSEKGGVPLLSCSPYTSLMIQVFTVNDLFGYKKKGDKNVPHVSCELQRDKKSPTLELIYSFVYVLHYWPHICFL